MSSSVIVEGANALDATLQGVRDSVRKRIMRGAVNKALVIVAGEIRKSVPQAKTRGHSNRRIKKSVGYRKYLAKPDLYSGKAGLRVGSTRNATIAPHAHFMALGTQERRTKSGASRGRVMPRGFVPQAYSRAQPKALEEMRKRFKKAVEREAEKQARKNRGRG